MVEGRGKSAGDDSGFNVSLLAKNNFNFPPSLKLRSGEQLRCQIQFQLQCRFLRLVGIIVEKNPLILKGFGTL